MYCISVTQLIPVPQIGITTLHLTIHPAAKCSILDQLNFQNPDSIKNEIDFCTILFELCCRNFT